VNSAYAALLALPPEELYGRRLDEVLEPSMWTLVHPQLASALRGESVHCEMTLPNQQKTMMASYTPEFGADGQVNGVAALLVDITERKKIEAALVRAEKFAATGRLAATIAHEINNPLESLTNLLYLLQHDDSLPEHARAHLRVADKELARVSDLTRQTLSFYRPQRACIRLDISVLLGEVLSLYAERLHRKHIKTNIEDESVTVAWIEGELRQIFSNIIANAIDALPAGGRLHIRITANAGRAMIEFSDNGTGIREEDLPHIFDPFFTTKEVYGTGLGLWVTRELLEKHGGTIAVSSSISPETRGTTVLVMLPVVEQRMPVTQSMRVS
jgi:signal transduction histidine kinase